MTIKHPKALPYLFLTELWERFGFYVVQGMLILYMTSAFGFSDNMSYTILGVFTTLAYISPMAGGLIADRILGFKTAIKWGAILLCLGYALLAFQGMRFFYWGLSFVIVGTGLFKPNISSLLGSLYKLGDSGRDTGFTIFYIGINIGVLLAGLLSGLIKNYFGWPVSFAMASFGLIIGLIVFSVGLKYGEMNYQSASKLYTHRLLSKPLLFLYCLISVFLLSHLLQSTFLAKWLLPSIGFILLVYIFYLAYQQKDVYRKRLIVLNILILSAIFYWAIFWQMFFSVNLFIDRLVDKQMFGFTIPTTVFYALESVFVILLGPGLAWSWHALNENHRNPSQFIKFVFGIIFAGLGFLALTLSTYFPNSQHLISPLWIVLAYLLITLGELLLSPIGLSAVTLLSPPRLIGMMMGIWFVALGFGGQFAGILAKLSSIPEGAVHQGILQLPFYRQAFLDYALFAFFVSFILYLLQRLLRSVLKE